MFLSFFHMSIISVDFLNNNKYSEQVCVTVTLDLRHIFKCLVQIPVETQLSCLRFFIVSLTSFMHRLGHYLINTFFPICFQFIIHWSSYHSALYSQHRKMNHIHQLLCFFKWKSRPMRYVKLQTVFFWNLYAMGWNCLLCLFCVNLYVCDPCSDYGESVEKNLTSYAGYLYISCAHAYGCVDVLLHHSFTLNIDLL